MRRGCPVVPVTCRFHTNGCSPKHHSSRDGTRMVRKQQTNHKDHEWQCCCTNHVNGWGGKEKEEQVGVRSTTHTKTIEFQRSKSCTCTTLLRRDFRWKKRHPLYVWSDFEHGRHSHESTSSNPTSVHAFFPCTNQNNRTRFQQEMDDHRV